MRPRRVISPENTALIFDEAVRERALAVLSIHDRDRWQNLKSRFLERDPEQNFFVLDYEPADGRTLPELQPGQCVGVSFRHRNRKVLFATVVEARGHYLVDNSMSVTAVRYRWPETLIELQRRSYYRTPVPANANLSASMWPGGLAVRPAAQGSTLEVTSGSLVDLSCGGALVRLSQAAPPAWSEDETLGLELHLGDGKPPVLLHARARGVRHDELGQLCVAIQFVGLELSVDGRLVLQRLARCVQGFHRLGISAGLRRWNPKRNE